MRRIYDDILDIPFEYREVLNIPKKVNFGMEFELDKVDPDEVYKLVRKNMGSSWIVKTDDSLTKGENAEIVSPVLQNTKDTWLLLREFSDLLKKINANYDKCSFQVNFDGSELPREADRVNFLKLFAMYEDIIFRFSKGDDSGFRESIEMHAAPIILALKGALSISDSAAVDMFSNQKRYGVTFKNLKNDLIEFRTPNMTSEAIYWQNYINTFYYLVQASKRGRYDNAEVDEYINSFARIYILEGYEREREEKAREFVKTIFPSNVDKSYFMHQYRGQNKK